MIDPIMNSLDSFVLINIIKGAGGVISNYQGNDPGEGNSIVVAGPELHRAVNSILN